MIDQQPVLPPGGRAGEHAGRLARDALVDRRDQRLGLGERHEPRLARRLDARERRGVLARQMSISAAIEAMPKPNWP